MPITSLALQENGRIAVFERGSRRLTSLRFDGSIATRVATPFAPQLGSVARGDGRWTVASVSRVPELAGLHFHVIDDRGSVVRSFGEGGPVNNTRYNGAVPHQRAIARRKAGGLWSVVVFSGQAHVLEEWSKEGALLRRVDLRNGWLPTQARVRTERIDPAEVSVSIHEDPQGRLWVTSRLLKPDPRAQSGAERSLPADLNLAYRSIVRVFDPGASRFIAALEMDGYLTGQSEGALWTQTRESATGEPFVQVYSMVLEPTSRGERK